MKANVCARCDGSGGPLSVLCAALAVTGGAARESCVDSRSRRRVPVGERRRRRAAKRFSAAVAIAMIVACACAAHWTPSFADSPKEVHGSGDAYAASGVVLAWGVLRGADEASTRVVLRIVADPSVYPMVTAIARNPFTNAERALLPPTPASGAVDVRVPRSQYADFPRSEVRLYPSPAAAQADTASLVVFYLGVPDTTPEFTSEPALQAYFADRIARARAAAGKTP